MTCFRILAALLALSVISGCQSTGRSTAVGVASPISTLAAARGDGAVFSLEGRTVSVAPPLGVRVVRTGDVRRGGRRVEVLAADGRRAHVDIYPPSAAQGEWPQSQFPGRSLIGQLMSTGRGRAALLGRTDYRFVEHEFRGDAVVAIARDRSEPSRYLVFGYGRERRFGLFAGSPARSLGEARAAMDLVAQIISGVSVD